MSVTSVRLPPEVEEKLAAVAERARRTKSWLINEAVADPKEESTKRRAQRRLFTSGTPARPGAKRSC